MMEQSCGMKGLNFNSIGPVVWQPCWIEGEILINVYSGTTASINVNLQSYDGALMWNEGFKFQLHRPHGLAAMLD